MEELSKSDFDCQFGICSARPIPIESRLYPLAPSLTKPIFRLQQALAGKGRGVLEKAEKVQI